jgi:hypothetical protein
MKKTKADPVIDPMIDDDADDMRAEYDFSGGVRGKYYRQVSQGTNVVLLEDDVSQAFSDSASVNQALRLLLRLAREQVKA